MNLQLPRLNWSELRLAHIEASQLETLVDEVGLTREVFFVECEPVFWKILPQSFLVVCVSQTKWSFFLEVINYYELCI